MLSLITFIPVIGAVLIAIAPRNFAKNIALSAALASFLFSIGLLTRFNSAFAGYQFVQTLAWLPQFGIQYKLGLDGINLWLVLLTTFIFPIAIGASRFSINRDEKLYYILMLLMQTATLGVFLALDLFLFYVFWEFALVPMYFIIGIWGGERRVYASLKFFLYTMAGSVFMLIAILVLANYGGTFDIEQLAFNNAKFSGNILLFLAFAIAFAIKVPMFPFHSWLPDAHVEAPTPGSVILAAVLLKMGSYGLIRFNLSLFPEASRAMAPLMIALAVIGILYGAIVAFAQSDMKKLIAYSSVSHMGYVVLGIFALNTLGVQGAILQMVNHGLSTGGLFLIVGFVYERLHTRQMNKLGGLWSKMPLYGTLALLFVLSSVGLPAMNGFVGEFVILQGAFQRNWVSAAFATFGMVLSAIYLLTMYQKVFLGKYAGDTKPNDDHAHSHDVHSTNGGVKLLDLNVGEVVAVLPLLALCFYIGIYSLPFFARMSTSVAHLLSQVGTVVR
jgi:NADH-quinone oxidoreductase subunit M